MTELIEQSQSRKITSFAEISVERATESDKVHPSDFIKKEDRWAGLHVSG